MDTGFILVPRSDFDSPIWQSLTAKQIVLFYTMVQRANYRDREWWDGRQKIYVRRGQFITSYRKLAGICPCALTVSSVRSSCAVLVSLGEIDLKPTRDHTLVTIINYERYADLNLYLRTPLDTVTAQQRHSNSTPTALKEISKAVKENSSRACGFVDNPEGPHSETQDKTGVTPPFEEGKNTVDNLVKPLAREKDISRKEGR